MPRHVVPAKWPRPDQAIPEGLSPVPLPVQAALERSLAAQLRTAVAQPLQDGFRASFQGTLLPAFESACQTMFSQVGTSHTFRCRNIPARFCHLSCLHLLLSHAQQPPARLRLVDRSQLPAFPAQAAE